MIGAILAFNFVSSKVTVEHVERTAKLNRVYVTSEPPNRENANIGKLLGGKFGQELDSDSATKAWRI